MSNYKFLFVMQLVYEYYDEFNIDNFHSTINKYFKDDKDKTLIIGMLTSCLHQLKLTKEELKKIIDNKVKTMTEDELEQTKKEWSKHKIYEKGKAI